MASMTIFYKHLTWSAFAVMAFPDDDEKARLCTAWLITRYIPDQLATVQPPHVVAAVTSDAAAFAPFYDQYEDRIQQGIFVGTLTNTVVSMINQDVSTASWERSMNFLIDNWSEARLNRSKLQALRNKYRTVYHLLGAYVDCRNEANEGRFSPKVMFAKAMFIHKIVSDWAESRGAPQTEVVEVPFDESLSVDLEELIPIELFPVPGRPGRPKNPRPK